ncbi:MAG: 1-deoxy-D-xylulose-5-phosphate reductoisomerase, partial [Terriglobia bacterium]
NKGLEVIEAHFLFGVGYDAIGVVIHPQSIVHAMVELYDGSIKAHLSPTDMRYPIQYALFYPDRRGADPLDLGALEEITFEQPDTETFPGLKLAFDAGRKGQTYPAVLNEANEVAVAAFLAHRIAFTDIAAIVADVLDGHEGLPADSLAAINAAQAWARTEAETLIDGNPR